MRNSPAALARVFLQPTGRGKGAKASPPILDVASTSVIDPNSGIAFEAELLAGGVPMVLPQILFYSNELSLTGSTNEGIDALLTGLASLLAERVDFIKKTRDEHGVQFEVTHYVWANGSAYQHAGTSVLAKPPMGLWHESLTVPATASNGERYRARLFRRSQGQLVLRTIPDTDVGMALTVVRDELHQMQSAARPAPKRMEQPGMHLGMNVSMEVVARALAKIGVNIACKEYGEAAVRDLAFAPVKECILTGSAPVRTVILPDPHFAQMFAQDAREVHLAMLHPVSAENGRHHLMFLIRLFGGAFQTFLLAENLSLPVTASPVVFAVHYLQHRVERQLLEDYLHDVVLKTPGSPTVGV